jgi:DNA-binding SARP family transcriptional activator
MQRLQLLGRLGLTAESGAEIDGLLRQPKRLAVLVYLALPAPGTWHRRDTLLELFWPELPAARARTSLRNTLYVLRQHLGDGTVRTRGDDEVSVDPARLTTDVADLEGLVTSGRHRDAVERYSGELLPAFFIPDAEGFEKWLDEARARLRALQGKAALALAEAAERDGDWTTAVVGARRLTELDPDDETAVRRLMQALDRSGDRAQALAAFERLRMRLAAEFEAEPSAETVEAAGAIRARRTLATADPSATTVVNPTVPPPDAPAPRGDDNQRVIGARPHRRWRALALLGGLGMIAGVIALVARRPASATDPNRPAVTIAPVQNHTGRSELDYVATAFGDAIIRRLARLESLTLRLPPRAPWPAAWADDPSQVAVRTGATLVLRSAVTLAGDSLEASVDVFDRRRATTRRLVTERFGLAGIDQAGSQAAAVVAGDLFRVALPQISGAGVSAHPDSYRLTIQGWGSLLSADDADRAYDLFTEAVRLDPSNARAWAGISSVWGTRTIPGLVTLEEGATRLETAAARAIALDSTQATAWANLAIVKAVRDRDLTGARELFAKAQRLEPGNPEVYMLEFTMWRFAGEWDRARDAIRVTEQLDPLTGFFVEREAFIAVCADRPAEALLGFRRALALDPGNRLALRGEVRSLARMGRWDEAIATWRRRLRPADSVLATHLAAAHGEQGYWEVMHWYGTTDLERRFSDPSAPPNPARLGMAYIAAGQIGRGRTLLEAAAQADNPLLVHLPCAPSVDEVRGQPWFEDLVRRYGFLKQHSPR